MANWQTGNYYHMNAWVDKSLFEWIERERGKTSRARFIRELLEKAKDSQLRSSNDDRSQTK